MRRALAALVAGIVAVVPGGPRAADPREEAIADAREFLARYVGEDGRVVRRDQGGDTVSEGQAYALLMAAAIGDEATFDRVWSWTNAHLRRSDDLLAWRWADGQAIDDEPAADADLLAAGALALAGRRFDDAALGAAAARLGDAVLRRETAVLGDRVVLLAGPWARERRIVNPSYFVVGAMSRLWWTGRTEWAAVAASSRAILDELTRGGTHLPPDWAAVGADGREPAPAPSPGGDTPRYGFDAVRVLVQLAVDCSPSGRAIAARAWPFLRREVAGTLEAVYDLDGDPLVPYEHPAAHVAAAAAAAAAGDGEASDALLDEADALDARSPTYYGAAWVAIGRLWLDTDLLGGCRPA